MQRCGLLGFRFVHRTLLPRVETRPKQQVHAPHSLGPRGTRIPCGAGRPGRDDRSGDGSLPDPGGLAPIGDHHGSPIREPARCGDRIGRDRPKWCLRENQVPISSDFRRRNFESEAPGEFSRRRSQTCDPTGRLGDHLKISVPHDIQNSISPKRIRPEKSDLNSCFTRRSFRSNSRGRVSSLFPRGHAFRHRPRVGLLPGRPGESRRE